MSLYLSLSIYIYPYLTCVVLSAPRCFKGHNDLPRDWLALLSAIASPSMLNQKEITNNLVWIMSPCNRHHSNNRRKRLMSWICCLCRLIDLQHVIRWCVHHDNWTGMCYEHKHSHACTKKHKTSTTITRLGGRRNCEKERGQWEKVQRGKYPKY